MLIQWIIDHWRWWRVRRTLKGLYVPALLDLGAGSGGFIKSIGYGMSYFGTVEDLIQFARKPPVSGCDFGKTTMQAVNDLLQLPRLLKWDAITLLAVLEHLDPEIVPDLFQTIYDRLVSGGLFVLTTPAPRAKRMLNLLAWMGCIRRDDIAEHKKYYSKKELRELLRDFFCVQVGSFQFGFNIYAVAWRM